MKFQVVVGVSLVLLATTVWGQQAETVLKSPNSSRHADPGPAPPNSTEAWLYTQELRRYEDPDQAVRRKAEALATQRMERIAALKWYGHSNARPVASPIPSMNYYSPSWVGNGANAYHWTDAARSTRVLYVVPDYVR